MKSFYSFKKSKGAAALSSVILISGVVVEIALVSLLISYLSSQEGLGVRMSYAASLSARSGINDAILKIIWDKNLGAQSYTLPVGNFSADVVITDNSDRYQIDSTGTAVNKKSKMRAVVIYSGENGFIGVESIKEIPINQ